MDIFFVSDQMIYTGFNEFFIEEEKCVDEN